MAFVTSEDDIEWTGGARNAEDGRAWASQYRGTKVMSRAGVSLGVLDDFIFDPADDRLVALVLDGHRMIEADDTVATGPAAVIIENPEKLQLVEQEAGSSDWYRRFTKT
ncbi:MAG: PRC-barrel domain containing protein [Proteobacteria bacterium]|nr:PRC-barrel domain containing protein [Pseudomonadota bacterium]